MATTFEVIFLGTLPRIDTVQGNEFVENATGLLGTYGTSTAPLSNSVETLSPVRLTEDDNDTYDTDNDGGFDSFSINGGTAQNFDGVALYDATVTYADGTTATLSAVIFQDVNGNTYLAPEMTLNADQAALTVKPIQSLSLNSVLSDNGDLGADRIAGDFKSAVDGTSNNDIITSTSGYVDPQGDAITTGNDFVVAGSGNDVVDGGDGNDFILGEAGNDTIDGGNGNDTILGGDGADSIIGGTGNDSLSGGAGDDHLQSGPGFDTLLAGDGNDVIAVSDDHGANTIDGGGWYDQLVFATPTSTAGVTVIWTGDGTGTYDFNATTAAGTFTGIEQSSGTNYADTYDATRDTAGVSVYAEGGSNTLIGGSGADRLYGGGGGDSLIGGQSSDTLDGGAGSDTITGGLGDDLIAGGDGDDVFRYVAGDGLDTISDFNFGNTGGLLDGDATNNDAINLSPYYDTIFEIWADQADDGILNQSNTTDTKGNTTDYTNKTQFASGQGIVFTGAMADSTFFTIENTGVVCFAKGTLILTTTGEVPIERLSPGDQIVTRDNGPQELVWVASRKLGRAELVRAPKLRPIRISPDLIAGHSPLIVSPQHGVLFRGDNGEETLVRATHLARMRGGKARVMQGCQGVSYFHLAFAAHQIIYANGAASESFYPGPNAVQGLAVDARTELSTLFPDLEPTRAKLTYGNQVRPVARYCDLPNHLRALAQVGV
ncbi:MAG: Hint domain-containing protein [Pelagibaca sp.]